MVNWQTHATLSHILSYKELYLTKHKAYLFQWISYFFYKEKSLPPYPRVNLVLFTFEMPYFHQYASLKRHVQRCQVHVII